MSTIDMKSSSRPVEVSAPVARYPFEIIRQRMRERGAAVMDFALGGQSPAPPDWAEKMIARHPEWSIRRRSHEDLLAFRESAAAMLERLYGVSVTPETVLPAPSGRAAMSLMTACLLAPGEGVLVTEPAYPAFARVAAQARATIRAVPLNPQRDFAPDLGVLDRDAAQSIVLAGLNLPNNPTGAVLTDAALAELSAFLREDAVLFNDATYGPLTYDSEPRSILSAPDRPAVELHSLAKIFALGPLTISFLIGTPSVMEQLEHYSEFAWSPTSSLQMQIARRCLDDSETLDRTRKRLGHQIATLRSALIVLGFEPYATPGGMYVLCKVPPAIREVPIGSATEAATLLFDRFGVAVVPYDLPVPGVLRFSCQYRAEDLEALVGLGADGPLVA